MPSRDFLIGMPALVVNLLDSCKAVVAVRFYRAIM